MTDILETIIKYNNLNDFDKISDVFNKSGYNIIGKGTSRIVFKLDEKLVLKVAMNNKGIYQNNHEYNRYCQFKENPVLNKTHKMFNDGYCIISDFMCPLNDMIFENTYMVQFSCFAHLFKKIRCNQKLMECTISSQKYTPILKNLIKNLYDFTYLANNRGDDILHIRQWGLTPENTAKLVDYGVV